jgi:hypothetical protein
MKIELNEIIAVKLPYDKRVQILARLSSTTLYNSDEIEAASIVFPITNKRKATEELNLFIRRISPTERVMKD